MMVHREWCWPSLVAGGALVAVLWVAPAAAQAGSQMAKQDEKPLAKLHAGNQAEIEAGTWMKEHATNDKVKDFASKMVDEHGSMDKDVMDFAQKHDIDLTKAIPAAEREKSQADLDRLKGMQGAQADRAYMKLMVQDHTKDVKETRAAAHGAKDKELATLLNKSAKTMEEHLKDAHEVQREITQRQARTPKAEH